MKSFRKNFTISDETCTDAWIFTCGLEAIHCNQQRAAHRQALKI
jgi:hypothetical protein